MTAKFFHIIQTGRATILLQLYFFVFFILFCFFMNFYSTNFTFLILSPFFIPSLVLFIASKLPCYMLHTGKFLNALLHLVIFKNFKVPKCLWKETLISGLLIFLYFTNQYHYIRMRKSFVRRISSGLHLEKLKVAGHGSSI